MSSQVQQTVRRIAAPDIQARKGGEPIVCLTAYDAPTAALLDDHCDLLLVGDSVGMVVHGLPNTVGVTMEMMILHGQAVMRGATRALVVVDLPFGSYEESPAQAFATAARVRSSAFGHRCEYVFSVVVVAPLWPIARCTVTTSHPAAIRPLA